MIQFRLTKKFAHDCKIIKLSDPIATEHPLDDWFIDRMIVDRKKIAIITHAKTAFTFLFRILRLAAQKTSSLILKYN